MKVKDVVYIVISYWNMWHVQFYPNYEPLLLHDNFFEIQTKFHVN